MKPSLCSQGTAATVLAGLYGAMKVKGLQPSDLKHQVLQHCTVLPLLITQLQTILVAGAGSAGSGVLLTIRNALNRRHGLTEQEASKR